MLEDYYNGKGPLPTLEQVGQTSGHKSSDDDEEMPFQDPQHTIEHIYEGSSAYKSKRQLKAAEREVNSIDPPLVNKLPKWSEVTISFEKSDCPILRLDQVDTQSWSNPPSTIVGSIEFWLMVVAR